MTLRTLLIYSDTYDSAEAAKKDGALKALEIPNTPEAYLAACLMFRVMSKETTDNFVMEEILWTDTN